MADPAVVALPKDVWVLVAEDVTTGYIYLLSKDPNVYLQTYRDTGNDAPDDDADAVPVPAKGIAISSTTNIDVYIKSKRVAGSVRVDIP